MASGRQDTPRRAAGPVRASAAASAGSRCSLSQVVRSAKVAALDSSPGRGRQAGGEDGDAVLGALEGLHRVEQDAQVDLVRGVHLVEQVDQAGATGPCDQVGGGAQQLGQRGDRGTGERRARRPAGPGAADLAGHHSEAGADLGP